MFAPGLQSCRKLDYVSKLACSSFSIFCPVDLHVVGIRRLTLYTNYIYFVLVPSRLFVLVYFYLL